MALGLKSGALAGVLLALAGCTRFSASPEERINAALPPAVETRAARQALDEWTQQQQPDAIAGIASEYGARLQARARKCAHGYRPSFISSDASIRRHLGDRACFERTDGELGQWIGLRHAGLLLAAPPLRPLPAQAPAEIVADAVISDALFASAAGVGVLCTGKDCRVVDIGSGEVLQWITQADATQGALSANGRLLSVPDGDAVAVSETETGRVLARFPKTPIQAFFWLGTTGAIRRGGEQSRPVFVDFSSGRETVVPMDLSALDQVVPAMGDPARFALLAPDRVGVIELRRSDDGWTVAPVSETRINEGSHWTRDTSGLTADGAVFFGAGQYLRLLDTRSMQMRAVAFEPMSLKGAVATADPARIFLTGYFRNAPGAQNDTLLYDIGRHSVVPVLREKLPSTRLLYIPSLRRNAVIDGSRIVLLDEIPVGAEAEPNAYIFRRASVVESSAEALPAMHWAQ